MNAITHHCPSRPPLRSALVRAAAVALATTTLTFVICVTPGVASAAEDATIDRLATCQDSWYEWKEDRARMTQLVSMVEASFKRSEQGAGFMPKRATATMGLPVEQLFPQSVGMGVGFSAIVHADFAEARRTFEQRLGRKMTCTMSEGTPACELELGPKKTAVLMTDDPRSKRTLLGCYYFYEK